MVTYTNKMNLKELTAKLKEIAKEHKAQLFFDDMIDEYKISTSIKIVFKDNSYVEFYDYKMTSLYSDDKPKPTAFHKTQYEWHCQGSNQLIADTILAKVNF